MWPGQQPPGGEQNPQHQNPYQQPNPYQQTGYQQPNPYQQPAQPQWGAPPPAGAPQPPSGGGNRTKVVAIGAATAVVVAAGVTGFLVLGGNKDDNAGGGKPKAPVSASSQGPAASASGSADDSRGTGAEKPTIPGWKTVVNAKWGVAFDVPADWEVKPPTAAIGYADDKTGKPIAYMSGIASYKPKWCTSDDDKDGRTEDTELAATGTKGAGGAKSTDQVALNTVGWWVYAPYTQPDKKSLTIDEKAQPYTTTAGVKGSIAWARSANAPRRGKCASDGKALSFGFKNAASDFVSWNFYGAKGVHDEVPQATIMKILSTVRLHGTPTGS
ncbi:hypothetical protein BFF78_25770 [Streptomyces fodineus]|uniref:DUF8017 domain-containing protein n=1 Tax=Streptomyces fodineus TaxID=1904616 RepID=A0A1D7YEN0_9ACTN|nr:hypothetical protein [Streptomyces fodineus]AOR34002.1 hypothetical protein BFF78_25770 [Streptomyces fodineus]